MAKKTPAATLTRRYHRFNLSARLQHILTLLSFTSLAITGLVQKFALSPISVFIVGIWGGIESVRATHHIAATVLMLIVVYHAVDIGYKAFVLRRPLSMLPGFQDARDVWMALTYNLGFGKKRPQMGRYTFEEKAEYWALVWGLVIMGVTGFMMWNPIATVELLPGEFIPAAKAAHGAEAILAVLAIIVWHMYGVHLRRFNKSMWTGNLTEQEMLHEHPLELADIKAGIAGARLPEGAIRRRRLVYYPIAGIVTLGMLFAIYGFVRGEETAITTVPPQLATVPVFVPQTPTPLPPTSTPMPSPMPVEGAATTPPESPAVVSWEQIGPILASKCGMCHGAATATGGLTLETLAGAFKGGQSGPVIIAGDAANSRLFIVQAEGGHPGQLGPEELAVVEGWIAAGALER